MNANGKQRRQDTGLNRHELHRSSHSSKTPAKIARAGWKRDPKKSTNARKGE